MKIFKILRYNTLKGYIKASARSTALIRYGYNAGLDRDYMLKNYDAKTLNKNELKLWQHKSIKLLLIINDKRCDLIKNINNI